jgi:Initiator Replication protein
MNLKTHGTLEEKTASYPLPQQMAYTKVQQVDLENKAEIKNKTMTALDYKMLVTLLFLSHGELEEVSGKGLWHEIDSDKLLNIFASHSGTKDLKRLWESFQRIGSLTVEYQRTDSDYRYEGITSLINIEKQTEIRDENNFKFKFQFPRALIPILLNPKLFAILKVSLILEMKSKYAIALYQILVPYAEMKYKNSVEGKLEEWKDWLKVQYSEKKSSAFNQFGIFRRDVLDVAVDELNEKSTTTGFTVSYELIRRGRGGGVSRIRFNIQNVPTVIEEKIKNLTPLTQLPINEEIKNSFKEDLNFSDATQLAIYFNKKWYGVDALPEEISGREKQIASLFLGDNDFSWGVSMLDIIHSFDDKPKFLGGLGKHKARAAGLLRKNTNQKQTIQSKRQVLNEAETHRQLMSKVLKRECMDYINSLSSSSLAEVETQIVQTCLSGFVPYFHEKRESLMGKSMREEQYFRWWLIKHKGKTEEEVNSLV